MMLDPRECFAKYFKGHEKYLFPSRVILEFTNCCNLSCAMCPRQYTNSRKGFLKYDLFKKVVDEISEYPGAGIIPFFRGESLLHPDFIPMLRYMKLKKISPVQLSTNGVLLSEKISEKIIDSGIDFISFSLDGFNESIYKKIRRGADFNLVVRNIENFLKKKKGQPLPQTQVSMVETRLTKKTIPDFVARWIDLVDRVRVYKEHSTAGYFGSLKDGNKSRMKIRKPCLKLVTEIAVCYNGDVAICNHDWNRKKFIGNAAKQTLRDIWNNRHYQALRRMHFEGDIRRGTVCYGCGHWKAYYSKDGLIGKLYTKKSDISAGDDV